MNARVYCFVSAKGGSGKTVITASLASFLSSVGKKCAILDCDAATNGMTLLYLTAVADHSNPKRAGLFESSTQEVTPSTIADSIVPLEPGVDLLPATYQFRANSDPDTPLIEGTLEGILSVMRSDYDFIFLDAQAGSDSCSRLCMRRQISDEVIIVSEYDPMSAAGVERLKQVAGDDLGYDRTWVLLNKMLPEFVERFSEFLSVAKYLPPIPWNAAVVRAYARRRTALDLDRGNEFTLAIKRTVDALLGGYIGDALQTWSQQRTHALRAPLEEQYSLAEAELAQALESKGRLARNYRWKMFVQIYIVALMISSVFVVLYPLIDVVSSRIDTYLIAVVGVTLAGVLWAAGRFGERGKTAEGARYDRLIKRIEEKLTQLDALRVANYETLVEDQNSERDS